MKQFLQIHNTDCNKRTNFRTFLQWKMREDPHRDTAKKNGTRKTRRKRNLHLAVLGAFQKIKHDDQKIYSRKLIS